MRAELIETVREEMTIGRAKWGNIDRTPVDFMIAIQEELGEVAHAINHKEGAEQVTLEIAQTIGLLSRLYEEVKDDRTEKD